MRCFKTAMLDNAGLGMLEDGVMPILGEPMRGHEKIARLASLSEQYIRLEAVESALVEMRNGRAR